MIAYDFSNAIQDRSHQPFTYGYVQNYVQYIYIYSVCVWVYFWVRMYVSLYVVCVHACMQSCLYLVVVEFAWHMFTYIYISRCNNEQPHCHPLISFIKSCWDPIMKSWQPRISVSQRKRVVWRPTRSPRCSLPPCCRAEWATKSPCMGPSWARSPKLSATMGATGSVGKLGCHKQS